jgi:hypothetical protein
MNNYAITISLYLVIAINHVAWANNHPHSLTISESWTDNGGLYFDADFYQKIANEKKYVPDGRLSGYVDTLMTWGMIESSKPIQLFGGSYALTNEYAVSIVCVNHQFADYLTPSNSVWAVITNSMGHVVNSECLYNQGQNRVYRENICSILGDNGRMVIQQTFEDNTCSVRYLNWKDLYEDGNPSVYFQCHDELWTKGSGDLMRGYKNLIFSIEDYIDQDGIVNLIKADYLRTDKICKQIELGQIKPTDNFLVRSVKTRTGNDYTILLNKSQQNDCSFLFRVMKCDIYSMESEQIVGESKPINQKAIRDIKVIIKSSKNKVHIKIRHNRILSARSILKLELN